MEALIAIISVLLIKLTAMIAGYKIVCLGHDSLVRGLKGEFVFTGTVGKERGLMLKGASPGLLFVLLGSLLIAWAMYVDKPISWEKITTEFSTPVISSKPDISEKGAK
ncbi:hypothetical protein [Pseudoduganella buxea]|uniref:Uncharacterized protein n=2 Tax=Pseudoduganella buxea TaxID=1949069 RepID=A0A6I3SU34_9BURK|nr:hypothetical protein [Pseudoduganella buxea]MTV52539.1 hypothetical protein [Pseudoduganella buxea]